jgi:protein ImuB
MPRVLCVWFPKWPIQRLRNERPELRRSELVLFAGQNQRLLVTACSPRAERRGVRAGQPLAEAKALVRSARFLPADAAADREALRQRALDGQHFSPLVGLEERIPPESLLCDVTGCTHLWNGEDQFLQAVREYWTGRGYHTQLALAGSVGAAWALAHTVTAAVVPAGEETAALSDLPVELLRLPTTVLERLQALGLRTVRDLLQLPRESLASRFDVILPQRLDQMFGRRPELFVAERLLEPLTVVREWDVPLEDRLTLSLICRQMLRTLLSVGNHPGAGFQELEGELRSETGAVKLVIRLVRPSRDEGHLAQLLELQLERCTWSGGVVAIRWTVVQLGPLPEVEHNWFASDGESDASRAVLALVDRLSSRLGDDVVLRVEALPDAQPEHAVQLTPWTKAGPVRMDEYALPPEQARCRPFRLLGVPQPIGVVSIVPDGPPIHITWRNEERRVIRCWGPERIATGWWRAPDVQRDYYRTEWEDGTHAWIFRDLRGGRWFLHGFFE